MADFFHFTGVRISGYWADSYSEIKSGKVLPQTHLKRKDDLQSIRSIKVRNEEVSIITVKVLKDMGFQKELKYTDIEEFLALESAAELMDRL